jgi:uncharacterized repeat protein (TIGR03803 family)
MKIANRAAALRPHAVSCAALLLAASTATANAQSFSLLYGFSNGGTSEDPKQMTMVEGTDHNFYGTTYQGGDATNYAGGAGTIFTITPGGTLNELWEFACNADGTCPNGRSPDGGVIQASDGNFYGTTFAGGTYDQGTIFRITPGGTLTTLYNFCWTPSTCSIATGSYPNGALLQASNGDLYGTTTAGTAFKISLKGKFTLLYTWAGAASNPEGSYGALIQVGTLLYGTTYTGGAYDKGTVFRMSLAGKVKTLHSFCRKSTCPDGSEPEAALVEGTNGDLYGTTSDGGIGSFGTVFKITTKGKLTTLVSFSGGAGPGSSSAQLTLAGDGTLWGTTSNGGGIPNTGFVFQIANDTLANAYELPACDAGGTPAGGLLLASNGNLYGSTNAAECGNNGTLFEFTPASADRSEERHVAH